MATATQNDNADLLILSDNDAETNTLVLDENKIDENNTNDSSDMINFNDFDIKEDTSNLETNKTEDLLNLGETNIDTLDFWSDLSVEDNIISDDLNIDNSNTEEIKSEELNNDVSLDLDMSDFSIGSLDINEEKDITSETTEESVLEITWTPDLSLESNNLLDNNTSTEESVLEITDNTELLSDFGSGTLDIPETTLEVEQELTSVWSMEDILDRAMDEMNSRLDIIKSEKDAEDSHISESKEQIENFEAKVAVAEEKLAELSSEEAMIKKNTKSLERMKTSNIASELKAETSTKVHNVKRKKAV